MFPAYVSSFALGYMRVFHDFISSPFVFYGIFARFL